MKSIATLFSAVIAALFLTGCEATYSANRAPAGKLQSEGTIVFTRPAQFTPFFGSHSVSEFVEIVYERVSRNDAGFLTVEVGIRNRGPVSWTNWDVRAPERLTLKVRSNFYGEGGLATPILYSTNREEIVVGRGETFAWKAVCPVPEASRYQVILGD